MSTPEDRLAALLRAEADDTNPSGGGLARIQQRVAFRRRARLFVVPGAALATAAAVGAFFLAGGGSSSSLVQVPGGGTSAGAPAPSSRQPSSAVPTVTSSCPAACTQVQPFVPAIWPFSSHAQTEAWRADPSSYPYARSNLAVATHFVTDVLHLTGMDVVQTCVSCDVVDVRTASGRSVGTVTLVREDDGAGRAFSVQSIVGKDLKLTSRTDVIGSPTVVTGTVQGVDENVVVQLLTQQGRQIASGAAPAGSDAPWSTGLTWDDRSWSSGALVLKTFSAKDGSLNRLSVSAVARDPSPAPVATVPCGDTTLDVVAVDAVVGFTGDTAFGFQVVNVGKGTCTLRGYASLSFASSDGTDLPFVVTHAQSQGYRDPGPSDVGLSPGGVAVLAVGKYRCDTSSVDVAKVRITLPGLAPLELPPPAQRPIGFCGVGDPGSTLQETAVARSFTALAQQG
jgi:hypothetical protein